MQILLALLVTAVTVGPGGATLTSIRSTAEPLMFSNPVLGMKGTIKPRPGTRFEVVTIDLGDVAIEAELRQFTLVTSTGSAFEPIAAGGGADLIFPIDSMPVGREIGQILPNAAEVSMTRTTPTAVSLHADPHGSLAFVFQVPHDETLRALKLPDGAELALKR